MLNVPASKLVYPAGLIGFPEFKTIEIRPYAVADSPAIVQAIENSRPELTKFMPWAHRPQTAEIQRERIAQCISDYWLGKDYTLGIYAEPGGIFLGSTGFHKRSLNSKGLEIGYWIHSKYSRRGLATFVIRILVVYGFSYFGLNRIQCGHDTKNSASRRVIEKCNFVEEGRLRNFDSVPSSDQIAAGWKGTGEIVMYRLLPEDVPSLAWYQDTLNSLDVYDWLGKALDRTTLTHIF